MIVSLLLKDYRQRKFSRALRKLIVGFDVHLVRDRSLIMGWGCEKTGGWGGGWSFSHAEGGGVGGRFEVVLTQELELEC